MPTYRTGGGIVTLTGASHSLANSEPRSDRDAGALPNFERCGSKFLQHRSFEKVALKGELAHRASLISISFSGQPSLCDNALASHGGPPSVSAPQGLRCFHPQRPRRSAGRGGRAPRHTPLRSVAPQQRFLCAGSPVERSPAPDRDPGPASAQLPRSDAGGASRPP